MHTFELPVLKLANQITGSKLKSVHEVFLMEYSYLQYTFYTLIYINFVTYTQNLLL